MSSRKEERIVEVVKLQREKRDIEQQRAEDQDLKNMAISMKKLVDMISEREKPYNDKIADIAHSIMDIHNILINDWDITDKTYKCDAGTATVRTTKSLRISDKKSLIITLFNIDKLSECIRTWNLSYLRKLKDIDLIGDDIASYDEHQNVVIKGVQGQ